MKVFYQRAYPIGPFMQEKIGFEIDTEVDSLQPDGSKVSPIEAVQILKGLCDAAHKEVNPGLEITTDYSTIPGHPMAEEPVDKRIAAIIEDLNACTEIDATNPLGVQIGLISYKHAAEANPEIKAAFDLKMRQLKK
jgi:hypothetical protein